MGGHINDSDVLCEGNFEVQPGGICSDKRAEHGDNGLFLFADGVEAVKAYSRSSDYSDDDGYKKFLVP